MIGKEFISKKPVSLVEVKAMLKEKKKDKELSYEQDQTLKYASSFAKLTDKQREKVFNELIEIDTINENIAVKILDTLPAELEIMKLIPSKEDGVSDEDLAKAFEKISKYVKTK